MLSTENPAEPSCSSEISTLKSDENAQKGLDLIKSFSDHKVHHDFSIRDYVFHARSKNIETNWPFPHRYLQLCLKHELKDILPPFDPPDYVRTHYSRKNIGVDSSITSLNGKENCRDFDTSSVLASSSGAQSPSEEEGPITKPVFFSSSENMTSNLCPVCKMFSSISNTTLNAHMDQCLSMEEAAFATALPKQFKHKVKPRKIKSMVDIYATAPPGTLEHLDKKNGTAWAFDPCKASVNEMSLEKKKESHSKLVIVEDENDDSSSGNLDCNWKKVRILTELNDSTVLPKVVDDALLKDMKSSNRVQKMFKRKKHLLSKCSKTLKAKSLIRKSFSFNSKVGEKCGKKSHISIPEDKEKSLSQFCEAPEHVRTSTGEPLSQWVRSKRSSVSRRFNNNAIKKTFECSIQATRNSLNHRNAFNIDNGPEKKTLSTQSSSRNSNFSARFKKLETIANSFYSSINDEGTQKHENILSSSACNTRSSLKNHKIDFPRNQMQSKRMEPVRLTTSPTEASEESFKRVTRSSKKLLPRSPNLKIILSNKGALHDESFLTDILQKTTTERTSKPVSTQEGQSRIRSCSRLHFPGSSCHKNSSITRRAHILKGIPCSQIRETNNEVQYKQAEAMSDIPEVDYVCSDMDIVDTQVRFAPRLSIRSAAMECISNRKNVRQTNLMSNESSIQELAILDSCNDNVVHIREYERQKAGEIPDPMDVDSTNEMSADNILQSDELTRKAEISVVDEVPTFENYYSASDMNLLTHRNTDLDVLQTNSSLYSSNASLDDNSNKLDETCTPLESPVSGLSTISLEPQVLSHDKLTAIDLGNNVESLLGYGLPSVRRSEKESTKLDGANNSSMTNALSLITALVSVSQSCCCSHRNSCMNHCCGAHGCSISCLKQEISSLFGTLPSLPNSTLFNAYLGNNVASFTGCSGSNLSTPASGVSFQPITSNPVLRLMGKNLTVASKDIDDSLQYQDASPTVCHPKSKDLNLLGLSKENFLERTIHSGGQSAYIDAFTSNNSQDKSDSNFPSSYEQYQRLPHLQLKSFGTTSPNESYRDRLHD